MSVSPSVCGLALSRSNSLSYGPKICMRIDLGDISNEFDGQGHRLKAKVAPVRKRDFRRFRLINLCRFTLSCHILCDVIT